MILPKTQLIRYSDSKTYPLGENSERFARPALDLVALTHTSVEQRLYTAMLAAGISGERSTELFTARQMTALAGIRSLTTVRRGLEGLIAKLSIERVRKMNGRTAARAVSYRVYPPEEVIERRHQNGFNGIETQAINYSFERAIKRVVGNRNLSRREAQVALCCVEGLTNAQIGSRLQVTEQTVKFHLRHVFIKLGVKRRAELISRLLM